MTIKNYYDWDLADLKEIYTGLTNIMGKNGFNGNIDAFNVAFGQITFVLHDFPDDGVVAGDATWQTGVIRLDPKGDWTTVVHEMGHMFSAALKRKNERVPSYWQMYSNVFDAGLGATGYAQDKNSPVEDFADSFLAVIEYGPKAIQHVNQSRINIITALIQSYTNSDHTFSPGR